jgi:hypothetical protein
MAIAPAASFILYPLVKVNPEMVASASIFIILPTESPSIIVESAPSDDFNVIGYWIDISISL